MKPSLTVMDCIFQANTAEPALPGCWCCPLEGEAADGRFGGGN